MKKALIFIGAILILSLFVVDSHGQSIYNRYSRFGQFQGHVKRGPHGHNFYGRHGQFQGHINTRGNIYDKYNRFQGRINGNKNKKGYGYQHRHMGKAGSQLWQDDFIRGGSVYRRSFGSNGPYCRMANPFFGPELRLQGRNGWGQGRNQGYKGGSQRGSRKGAGKRGSN